MFLQVFICILSRAFLACRDCQSLPSSPGGANGTVILKQLPPDDSQSADTPSGEAMSNQREWSVVLTVLDRVCFTLSVAAVAVALVIFFPR